MALPASKQFLLTRSRLRLVSIPSAASTVVVGLIDIFARQNRQTCVSLEVQSSDSALEWVISQLCDFGIAAARIESPAIRCRTIQVGASVCILPKGHALAHAEMITAEMLEGESFISFRPDSIYRRDVDALFKSAGVSRRLIYEARTTDSICGLVAAGLGVSVVGPLATSGHGPEDAGRNLTVRPFLPALPVELSIMWSTHRSLSASAREFLKIVERHYGLKPA